MKSIYLLLLFSWLSNFHDLRLFPSKQFVVSRQHGLFLPLDRAVPHSRGARLLWPGHCGHGAERFRPRDFFSMERSGEVRQKN